jgi:thioredoxin-like negative regulator of GroEL
MAPFYRNTLFVRASVADSLFLVAKFEVKVLPCVMCFVNGRCVDRYDRLTIFQGLGHGADVTAV